MSDVLEVIHNAEDQRYEGWLDGVRVGLADARVRGDIVVMSHTEVDSAYGGRGFAAEIVAFALDDIRAQGRRVKPVCPYVARYIERHPDYQDLL